MMYSNNDWRYYLEHQLEQSDDYLAHYGVKNMKWGKRKQKNSRLYNIASNSIANTIGDTIVNNTVKTMKKTGKTMKQKIADYKKKKKKKLSNPLAPKNQTVEVISFKDKKTGKDWKK